VGGFFIFMNHAIQHKIWYSCTRESYMADTKNGLDYFADAMKKYVVFNGRARRAEYWWFTLCVFVILVITELVGTIVFHIDWLQNIAKLFFLFPNLAIGWRRMHDVGKSGVFIFIPIYNLILACTPGVAGPNEYGPDPKVSLSEPINS
jgi:uncharacterized membrane protein YhaH (DUF805 family)